MDQKLQLIETGHLMKTMERELAHMLTGVNTAQNPAGRHTKSTRYSRHNDITEGGSTVVVIFM